MKAVTDYCIECGMCAVECPSNVNIPKLMLEAKSKYRAARTGHAGRLAARPRGDGLQGRAAPAPLANPLLNQACPPPGRAA